VKVGNARWYRKVLTKFWIWWGADERIFACWVVIVTKMFTECSELSRCRKSVVLKKCLCAKRRREIVSSAGLVSKMFTKCLGKKSVFTVAPSHSSGEVSVWWVKCSHALFATLKARQVMGRWRRRVKATNGLDRPFRWYTKMFEKCSCSRRVKCLRNCWSEVSVRWVKCSRAFVSTLYWSMTAEGGRWRRRWRCADENLDDF